MGEPVTFEFWALSAVRQIPRWKCSIACIAFINGLYILLDHGVRMALASLKRRLTGWRSRDRTPRGVPRWVVDRYHDIQVKGED
jgi:hypothetical protein